jgi:hypothetical protein
VQRYIAWESEEAKLTCIASPSEPSVHARKIALRLFPIRSRHPTGDDVGHHVRVIEAKDHERRI